MEASAFQAYLGTLWIESGASLSALADPRKVEIRITAPPREEHTLSDTSRILRVACEEDRVIVWLSQR